MDQSNLPRVQEGKINPMPIFMTPFLSQIRLIVQVSFLLPRVIYFLDSSLSSHNSKAA